MVGRFCDRIKRIKRRKTQRGLGARGGPDGRNHWVRNEGPLDVGTRIFGIGLPQIAGRGVERGWGGEFKYCSHNPQGLDFAF